MAYKKLNEKQLHTMKNLLMSGETPSAVAKLFNIGVSSVYNYRNAFRKEGLVFPVVKGKRPDTIPPSNLENLQDTLEIGPMLDIIKSVDGSYYRLNVNGTEFLIPQSAKKVTLDKGGLVIKLGDDQE